MSGIQVTDKFIGFLDIIGFKSIEEEAEAGRGLALSEIPELISCLGTENDRQNFEQYGPTICPQSRYIRKDLDFQITQVSDCVIVSVEVSPAGMINLIKHCDGASMKLLKKGVMCRGYIKRGLIHHSKDRQFGTGLSAAAEKEKKVSVFRQDADERGTPFIEIDANVISYLENDSDTCVKEQFSRMVERDGELAALFPFKRLHHSFIIGGAFGPPFDPNKELSSVNVVRGWINKMKEQVKRHINRSDADAVRKGDHYIRMLDAQLVICDETEQLIRCLNSPFPRRT